MHYFNTAGPCNPEKHYMLPAMERLPQVQGLVEREGYFVLYAPRQTGKTTALRDLTIALTAKGLFAAVYASCEAGQAVGEDYENAQRVVLSAIQRAAGGLPADCRPPVPWPALEGPTQLLSGLAAWAAMCPKPIALVLDEIDALRGASLISVLRQLRAGFPDRPAAFPASVILCGLRDVRDYKAASGGDPERLGSASPFNVKVDSIRLRDFTAEEVARLYGQHSAATGQPFTAQALAHAWALTAGQPWLVNALAREVVEKMAVPTCEPITAAHLDQAKERLIQARATHLDSLVERLRDPRVRRVLEPLLAGGLIVSDSYDDDFQYVRDLGLVAPDTPVRVANPIYREVIVRVLSGWAEGNMVLEPRIFVQPDGKLDLQRVLDEFAAFWRQHGEVLSGTANWREVAAQLILMAWLQRIVNGGGYVDREYGIGRGRIDLLLRWPWRDAAGRRQEQREALELKVWAPGRGDPLPEGLRQLDGYLERLGLDRGVLVIFDRRPEAGEAEVRTRFERQESPAGRVVTLLRA